MAGLGDQKPTELLRYMKSLHKTDSKDVLFMALFVQQLPSSTRSILAAQDFDDVNQLAQAADEVLLEQSSTPISPLFKPLHRQSMTTKDTDTQKPGLCYYHKQWGPKAHKCQLPCNWTGNEKASH